MCRPGVGAPSRARGSRSGSGAASRGELTVLSAPAGFGKTTCLTEWLATLPRGDPAVAWLSLDAGDNDPALFWTYVVTAIRTAVPGVGSEASQLLASSPPAVDAALAALLNDLGGLPDGPAAGARRLPPRRRARGARGMAFLLEHQPPQLHVVLATRSDPPLPLARMRARGQLVEVRAADLRFTVEESAAYLNGPMGLRLSEGDVAALDGRTEGWIAALQLAALSMQGRDDVERVHRRVRRRRPLHRGLPRRGGPRPPAAGRPRVPAADVDPRAAHRPALRRRHRTRRRQGDPGGARARQPVPRPARRPAAVVPVPPPVRRRPAGPPARRAPRPRWPSCTGGPAPGSRPTATARRRSATPWPAVTSAAPPTSWSSRCR